MNESSPPPVPPAAVARRKRLGCLPMGCLIVVVVLMLLGVGLGTSLWLFYQGGQAFMNDHPTPTRIAEATEEQYQGVLGKLAPFAQAMQEGHAATAELTPDDANVLIARAPQFASWRGRVFLEAKSGGLAADVSVPLGDEGSHPLYFSGHTTFDASYASNGFALFLHGLTPLGAGRADSRFARFLNYPGTLQVLNQKLGLAVNETLRDAARKDAATADLLRKLRTVIVQDGKIVVTVGENPAPATPIITPGESPNPSPTPVATPADRA